MAESNTTPILTRYTLESIPLHTVVKAVTSIKSTLELHRIDDEAIAKGEFNNADDIEMKFLPACPTRTTTPSLASILRVTAR